MPKLKRLLVSACFETAQRRRHCSRNQGHVICHGEKCLVVKENISKNNYCMEFAALILLKAREELGGLLHKMNDLKSGVECSLNYSVNNLTHEYKKDTPNG